jgi:drug/metabolite transporter (DMT)-like permease
MQQLHPREPNIAAELALLLLLATLWGASYTFIKLGVATIPPITLIAARTLIAGLLLVIIMRWRALTLPKDAATWRRFPERWGGMRWTRQRRARRWLQGGFPVSERRRWRQPR